MRVGPSSVLEVVASRAALQARKEGGREGAERFFDDIERALREWSELLAS